MISNINLTRKLTKDFLARMYIIQHDMPACERTVMKLFFQLTENRLSLKKYITFALLYCLVKLKNSIRFIRQVLSFIL